eukprot:1288221-Amphidinium_carterae.2
MEKRHPGSSQFLTVAKSWGSYGLKGKSPQFLHVFLHLFGLLWKQILQKWYLGACKRPRAKQARTYICSS